METISDQIKKIGIYRTGQQLRNIAVRQLRDNKNYFKDFVDDERGFDMYVTRMSRPSTYGDHLTLQTLAIEFHCQFFILSVQGRLHHRIVSETDVFDLDVPLLSLGYYPEEKGEHYVSIEIEPQFLNRLIRNTAGSEQSSEDDHPYISDTPTDHHAAHNSDALTEWDWDHPYNSDTPTEMYDHLGCPDREGW